MAAEETAAPAATMTMPSLSTVSWVAYCVSLLAVSLVADSIPFAGKAGIFAAGGRAALRIAALGIPLVVSAVLWAIEVGRGERVSRVTPALWGLGGLTAVAVLATVFAIDRRVALFGFWLNEQGLIMWLLFFGLAFLGSQLVRSRRRLVELAASVVGAGSVVAGIALIEIIGFRSEYRVFGVEAINWMYQRGVSTMMNPDFLGTYLVLPFVLGVGLVAATEGWHRWLAGIGTAMMGVSLIYTLTRGAWIGACVGLVVFGVLSLLRLRALGSSRGSEVDEPADTLERPVGGPKRLLLVWAVVAALVLGSVAILGTETLSGRFSETVADAKGAVSGLSGRMALWNEVWPAVLARPILGSGPDNINYAWQPYADLGTLRQAGVRTFVDSSHNFYLDLAVQFGLPFALVFLLGAAWLMLKAAKRGIQGAAAGHAGGGLEMAWAAALAGLGVSFITGITVVPVIALGFAALGVLLALDAGRPTELEGWQRNVVPIAMSTIALVVGLVALLSGVSAIAGNQSAPSYPVRVSRDLAALRWAPWRIYPASDLAENLPYLSEQEQGLLGINPLAAFEMLLDRDGKDAINLFTVGDFHLMARRDPETALRYADRSLLQRPLFVPGLMLKGDALAAMGRTDEALGLLKESVDLEEQADPWWAWPEPWVSYLTVLINEGRENPEAAAEARAVLDRYKSRYPDNPDIVQFEEGIAAMEQGEQPAP